MPDTVHSWGHSCEHENQNTCPKELRCGWRRKATQSKEINNITSSRNKGLQVREVSKVRGMMVCTGRWLFHSRRPETSSLRNRHLSSDAALVKWGTGLDTLEWAEETSEARILRRWGRTVEWGGGRGRKQDKRLLERLRPCPGGDWSSWEGLRVHSKFHGSF